MPPEFCFGYDPSHHQLLVECLEVPVQSPWPYCKATCLSCATFPESPAHLSWDLPGYSPIARKHSLLELRMRARG